MDTLNVTAAGGMKTIYYYNKRYKEQIRKNKRHRDEDLRGREC